MLMLLSCKIFSVQVLHVTFLWVSLKYDNERWSLTTVLKMCSKLRELFNDFASKIRGFKRLFTKKGEKTIVVAEWDHAESGAKDSENSKSKGYINQ